MKLGRWLPPILYYFFKIVLAILDSLPFHTNSRINSSILTEYLAGILIGIVLSLNINLERIVIVTMLSLPIFLDFLHQDFIVFKSISLVTCFDIFTAEYLIFEWLLRYYI